MMRQITEEQKPQVEAATERIAVKLQAFHDGLPADEQLVLDLAFNRLAAGEEAAMGEELAAHGQMIAQERL